MGCSYNAEIPIKNWLNDYINLFEPGNIITEQIASDMLGEGNYSSQQWEICDKLFIKRQCF